MQKYVRARLEVFRTRVFDLVVADAVLARYEDHGGRRDPPDVNRIVGGAAHDVAIGKTQLARGITYCSDAAGIETGRGN